MAFVPIASQPAVSTRKQFQPAKHENVTDTRRLLNARDAGSATLADASSLRGKGL